MMQHRWSHGRRELSVVDGFSLDAERKIVEALLCA